MEGPAPLSLPQEAKVAANENPANPDELDTPTSIASVMTSTNESSTETDTPQQTDSEVYMITPLKVIFTCIFMFFFFQTEFNYKKNAFVFLLKHTVKTNFYCILEQKS